MCLHTQVLVGESDLGCCSTCPSFHLLIRYSKSSVVLDELVVLSFMVIWVYLHSFTRVNTEVTHQCNVRSGVGPHVYVIFLNVGNQTQWSSWGVLRNLI